MMGRTFIFDYDDTLAWNQHDYTYAQIEFVRWLVETVGPRSPDIQSIINLVAETDKAAVATMGFRMERFPTSFQDTYRAICGQLGVPVKDEHLATAYDLGMLAFDEDRWRKQGLVEGARETLDFLLAQGDELMLLTKGDPRVQERKLRATGCERWFGQEMHIVPKKDASVLLGLVGARPKDFVWHVGNSVRSDVQPAIDADIGMIYIPCETWAYEREHKGLPDYPRLVQLGSVGELPGKYSLLKNQSR